MKFCITCKHWDPKGNIFTDGHQECNKLTEELSDDNRFFDVATGDESSPFVTTSCSFGCIFHEEK